VLNEDDLEEELNQLDAQIAEMDLPGVHKDIIKQEDMPERKQQ